MSPISMLLRKVESKTTHEPPQATTTYHEPPRPTTSQHDPKVIHFKNLRNTTSQTLKSIKTVIKQLINNKIEQVFCLAYYRIQQVVGLGLLALVIGWSSLVNDLFVGSNWIDLQTVRAQFQCQFKMEGQNGGSDSENELLKDLFSTGKRKDFTPKKVESEHSRKKTHPEQERPEAKRRIFMQGKQKFAAVLVISDDENENTTDQVKEDILTSTGYFP